LEKTGKGKKARCFVEGLKKTKKGIKLWRRVALELNEGVQCRCCWGGNGNRKAEEQRCWVIRQEERERNKSVQRIAILKKKKKKPDPWNLQRIRSQDD